MESGAARWRARPNVSRKSGGIFDIEGKRGALSSLDLRMADPSFWSNQEEAQRTLQEVKSLRAWVDPYEKLESRLIIPMPPKLTMRSSLPSPVVSTSQNATDAGK